jgi:hypothetical protein
MAESPTFRRRLRLAGWMVLAAALGMGCSLSSLPYFLSAGDSREAPMLMGLTPPEKGKPVRVAVMAYQGGVADSDLVTVERDLESQLSQQLFRDFKENKQAVSIVPTGKVQEFKNNNPGWKRSMDLKEIAQYFKVDYLIYLEVDSISLYQTGSARMLFQGRANITVSLLNARSPDESPSPKTFACMYPSASKAPIPVDPSTSPRAFYMAFVEYMGKRLAWYFIPHEINQDITCE